MRIISKFHDYYDSVLSYGQDTTICYIRNTEIFPKDSETERLWRNILFSNIIDEKFTKNSPPYSLSRIMTKNILSFLGKPYPYYEINNKCFFTGESLKKYCETILLEKNTKSSKDFENGFLEEEIKKFAKLFLEIDTLKNEKTHNFRMISYFSKDYVQTMNSFLIDYPVSQKLFDLHVAEKTPIVILKHLHENSQALIKNPNLEELSFASQKDSYTAFQELSQFFGGILPNENPKIINLNDKDKLAKHGFDQFSFKTPPSQKKK